MTPQYIQWTNPKFIVSYKKEESISTHNQATTNLAFYSNETSKD